MDKDSILSILESASLISYDEKENVEISVRKYDSHVSVKDACLVSVTGAEILVGDEGEFLIIIDDDDIKNNILHTYLEDLLDDMVGKAKLGAFERYIDYIKMADDIIDNGEVSECLNRYDGVEYTGEDEVGDTYFVYVQ